MNKKTFLTLAAISLAMILPHMAQAIIIDAQVSSVTGTAYVLQPGSLTKLELKPGMSLAQGSTITTESGSVGLQLMPGAATVIEPSSELSLGKLDYEKKSDDSLKRNVLLDLKKGSILSNLEKVGTSDFKIKTPYGVAAARGTTWKTTSVGGAGAVRVYNGTVEVRTPDGKTYSIGKGTFMEIKNGQASDVQAITQEEIDQILEQIKEAFPDALPGDLPPITPGQAGEKPKVDPNFNPSNLNKEERSDSVPRPR
jgi:hypothetical protein